MYSWPPISQTPYVFSSWQFPTFSLPPLRNPTDLNLYSLVPLQREPETLQASPQMRIYDESNPNQYIEKNDDAIMKEFTKFLEENPSEISKISSSNIKISYEILAGNNLSLSFDFEPSNRQNQDSITFVNSRGDQHKATKNTDIQYLEKQIVITSDDSPSTSHFIIPNEVAIALKKYVKNTGEIPTHNLIISFKNNEFFFEESKESIDKVKDNQCFIVKLKNSDDTITIGKETRESLEKIVEEVQEDRVKACERALEESRLEKIALRLKEKSDLIQEKLNVWREENSAWKPTIEYNNIFHTSFSALSLLESDPTSPNSPSALSKINYYLKYQERGQEEEMEKKIANKSLILLKTELMKIKIRDIVKSMIESPTSGTSNEENYLKIQQEKENILYKILLVETAKDEKIKALLIDCLLENNTDKISKLNSLIFEKKILPTEVSSLDYVGENVIIKDLIIGEGLKLLDNYKKIGREFSDAVVNEEINRSNAIGENLDLAQNALNQFIEKTGITIATLQSEETKKNVQENLKMQRMNEAEIRASSFALELGINNSDSDFLQRLESAIERQKANQPQPAPSSPSTTSTPPALKR